MKLELTNDAGRVIAQWDPRAIADDTLFRRFMALLTDTRQHDDVINIIVHDLRNG